MGESEKGGMMEQQELKVRIQVYMQGKRGEDLSGLIWGGVLAGGAFIGIGVLAKFALGINIPEAKMLQTFFWLFYFGVFAVLMFLARLYEPKEKYEFYLRDNPLTRKDNRDAEHALAGLLLMIPNFFYNYLKSLVSFFVNSTERFDTNLAAKILAEAKAPHYTIPLQSAFKPGYQKESIEGTLLVLEESGLISISRGSSLLMLTLSGRQVTGQDNIVLRR